MLQEYLVYLQNSKYIHSKSTYTLERKRDVEHLTFI